MLYELGERDELSPRCCFHLLQEGFAWLAWIGLSANLLCGLLNRWSFSSFVDGSLRRGWGGRCGLSTETITIWLHDYSSPVQPYPPNKNRRHGTAEGQIQPAVFMSQSGLETDISDMCA